MLRILTMLIFVSTIHLLNAQSPTFFDSLYRLQFDYVELEIDIDSLLEFKLTGMEHASNLRVISGDKAVMDLPLKVSVRSKSRRRYCDFPPIKLNLVKGDLEKVGLDREDEFKIVTHCLENEEGEEVLVKEHLMYELYSILTPISLKSKLFDIVYIDKKSGKRISHKALILESEKEFAKRHQSTLCDCMGTVADSIQAFQFELLAMFQYMIGNEDMDHRVERNVKLLRPENGNLRIPVAYDFDFSSMVNAPYVYPKVRDNISVKRKYLGFKVNREVLPQVMEIFKDKKKDLIRRIKDFEYISSAEQRRCIAYIHDFYHKVQENNLRFEYKDY